MIEKKQLPYGLIYTLRPVELKTLKTFIETYLKTRFIQSFKSTASAFILFDKKVDSNLHLYVDYQDLNNLIIKDQYPLLLIHEFLDQLVYAK